MLKLYFIQNQRTQFLIKKLSGHGNLLGCLKNWAEIKMMLQRLECTVWYAYIYGVYGNIGQEKEESEENVHVTEVCMTLLTAWHLQVQPHYRHPRLMCYLD